MPPGLLSEDEDEDEEVRPTKHASQTSGNARARDKEVRHIAKTLPVQLTNEQWAEICEWIEENTHWGLVRNIWRGRPNELHRSVRILLHFTQFAFIGKSVTPPMDHGSMSRLMFGLTKATRATMQDEAEDEAEVCVLCCQKRSTVTVCDECKEHHCTECIDTHTCGTNVVC